MVGLSLWKDLGLGSTEWTLVMYGEWEVWSFGSWSMSVIKENVCRCMRTFFCCGCWGTERVFSGVEVGILELVVVVVRGVPACIIGEVGGDGGGLAATYGGRAGGGLGVVWKAGFRKGGRWGGESGSLGLFLGKKGYVAICAEHRQVGRWELKVWWSGRRNAV